MKIIYEDKKTGFIYKDVEDKQNYGIFHRDTGDKQHGWISKNVVKDMIDKNPKED